MRRIAPASTLLALGLLADSEPSGGGRRPDTIWLSVTVITMECDTTAEAVAASGDEVVAVGPSANLVILDANPLTVEPAAIRDIQVLETIVGGHTVYLATGQS